MDVNRGIAYIIHLLVTINVLILCAFPMTHLPSPFIFRSVYYCNAAALITITIASTFTIIVLVRSPEPRV